MDLGTPGGRPQTNAAVSPLVNGPSLAVAPAARPHPGTSPFPRPHTHGRGQDTKAPPLLPGSPSGLTLSASQSRPCEDTCAAACRTQQGTWPRPATAHRRPSAGRAAPGEPLGSRQGGGPRPGTRHGSQQGSNASRCRRTPSLAPDWGGAETETQPPAPHPALHLYRDPAARPALPPGTGCWAPLEREPDPSRAGPGATGKSRRLLWSLGLVSSLRLPQGLSWPRPTCLRVPQGPSSPGSSGPGS